jgi:nucleotidyltransferase/DNA polymerase involved in DNA repair
MFSRSLNSLFNSRLRRRRRLRMNVRRRFLLCGKVFGRLFDSRRNSLLRRTAMSARKSRFRRIDFDLNIRLSSLRRH